RRRHTMCYRDWSSDVCSSDLDLVLCPTCGADNDPSLEECEVCGSTLRGTKEPNPMAPEASPATPQTTTPRPVRRVLDKVDEFLKLGRAACRDRVGRVAWTRAC